MKVNRAKLRQRQGNAIQAIKELAACWRAAWLAGDVDTLISLYGTRPVLMPHGRPSIFGKRAIRSLYRAVLSEVRIQSRGRLREVRATGNWGYFWSTYSLKATSKRGGGTITSKGKSVFIVNRQRGGVWKIARLIDNSDE